VAVAPGDAVRLAWPQGAAHYFDADGRRTDGDRRHEAATAIA